MTRIKVDENLHPEVAEFLRSAGFDARTVAEQGHRGAADSALAEICERERRIILTLDLDFADLRRFPPERYAGIVVLRLGSLAKAHTLATVSRLSKMLRERPLEGELWVVSETAVRVVRPDDAGAIE
ncbi:MAG: DUF5615 family PIN-like protein [Phycisphaerae bacterium]